jgi:hypothetical protein
LFALLLGLTSIGCADNRESVSDEVDPSTDSAEPVSDEDEQDAPADSEESGSDEDEQDAPADSEESVSDEEESPGDGDPPILEIPEEFSSQADQVLAAVTERGYDTTEGEAPSSNLITRAAFAIEEDVALGEFFMVSVAWQIDKPFGNLGELDSDSVYETDDGLAANFVTVAEGERSVWFSCGESLVTFDLISGIEDGVIEEFTSRVFSEAC